MRTFWHPYLWRQALRTLEYVAALTVAVGVLVVLTDEPGSTARMRVARVCALSPLVVAVAIWSVLAQANARGELRALAALGVRPGMARLGALVASWAVLLLVLGTLLSLPEGALLALFPRAASSIQWSLDAGGGWHASSHAITAFADGSIRLGALATDHKAGAPDFRAAVAAAFGPVAIAIPFWAAQPMPTWTRTLSGAVAVMLMLCCLHAVAARGLNELVMTAVVVPLLVGLTPALGAARRGQRRASP